MSPEFDGHTFVLPLGVAPLTVHGISARSEDGATVVVRPQWEVYDVPTLEEDL